MQKFLLLGCLTFIILSPNLVLSQKIESDQTSYTNGGRTVVTDITSLQDGLLLRMAARQKGKNDSITFIVEIKIIEKGSNKYLEPGDNLFIVFKDGSMFRTKNYGEEQRSKLALDVFTPISQRDWVDMGFGDGYGSQIVEFRIEDKAGVKIYSFPFSPEASTKFYRYAYTISKRVL